MSTISQHTLGKYFRKGGKIYRHIIFCEHPTATLEALNTGVRVGGAVGSLILSDFEALTEAECRLLDEAFNDTRLSCGYQGIEKEG